MAATTTGDRFCAAMLCGERVRIEYAATAERVNVAACHLKGVRIPADRWDADQLADWQREAECAEITAQECPDYREAA